MSRFKRLNPFSDKEYLSRLAALTLPMVLQHLMLASVAVSDAFMLGSLEQNAMSAVSLATQIQFIQNVLLGGMTAAVSVLAAQYWGKKDSSTVRQIMAIGVRVGSLISVVFALGCLVFPAQLMRIFTNAP
ncbi:MAG: MATE family efflux transporter [Clostridia bacterium]|nr:MATE family efflux transporter [Clostridia bacterium]